MIVDCGELKGEEKLKAEDADFLSTYSKQETEETPEDKRVEIWIKINSDVNKLKIVSA